MMLCMKEHPTTIEIPRGFEALEPALPLTMLITTPEWWIAPSFDQQYAAYGLLLFNSDGIVIAFLSTAKEIDALCAMIRVVHIPPGLLA